MYRNMFLLGCRYPKAFLKSEARSEQSSRTNNEQVLNHAGKKRYLQQSVGALWILKGSESGRRAQIWLLNRIYGKQIKRVT
jgi:hypothetical protein